MLDLSEMLRRHLIQFSERSDALAVLGDFLSRTEGPTRRDLSEGHVVASGIVTNGPRVLLVRHLVLQRWLQPGGHLEKGEDPWVGAGREVWEETGLRARLDGWHEREGLPVDIDVHRIPVNLRKGEGAHVHFDFRYLFWADDPVNLVGQPEEVTAVAWWEWSEAIHLVPSLGRTHAHARRLGLL